MAAAIGRACASAARRAAWRGDGGGSAGRGGGGRSRARLPRQRAGAGSRRGRQSPGPVPAVGGVPVCAHAEGRSGAGGAPPRSPRPAARAGPSSRWREQPAPRAACPRRGRCGPPRTGVRAVRAPRTGGAPAAGPGGRRGKSARRFAGLGSVGETWCLRWHGAKRPGTDPETARVLLLSGEETR